MTETRSRFVDTQQTLEDFTDEFLVVCPQCKGCARIGLCDPERTGLLAPRRLTCGFCGHNRVWAGTSYGGPRGQDWYFRLPLWLTAPCCGEVLWAHNWRHLQFIENFVRAGVRENVRDPENGWSNRSLANRLPTWIKDRNNRAKVLRTIEKLKQTR